MCGICGIIGNNRSIPDRSVTISRMMDRMAHRGPDDKGTHNGNFHFFGNIRLAVIDIEYGHQPMVTADGRYVLVFNGEIYNYLELRQKLIDRGVQFRTQSDTEVLLQLLVHDGEDALKKLNGMFAFALFDNHTKQWMIARDPLGIKPLYYAILDREIVFASEIKALLVHPDIRAECNWTGLQHYLTFQFCLGSETLFKGIRQLEPGFYMKGSTGKVDARIRYWDTNYNIVDQTEESYFTEKLRSLIDEKVGLQIRSDVPLGAYLSGGLDSTTVATMASNHLGQRLKVFHGRFYDGPAFDESPYARIVANELNAELIEVVPTPEEFADILPRLIYFLDEPVAGPGLFPQYIVSKAASKHVKVILGGQGGDEVFGGYARYLIGYLEQALKGAIFETQEEGKHLVTLNSIIPNLPILKEYRPLMQHFWKDGLFDNMDGRYFRLIDRSPDIANLLTEDALSRFNREQVFSEFQEVFNHPETKSYVNKMTHFDLKTLLPALLQVEDRMSMAVSLESRVPLLDIDIVNFATTMPPQIKFQGGRSKHILRKAVSSIVSDTVLQRKDKMGFPVPLKKWLENGPVKDFVHEVLLGKASKERGLFKPSALEKLIHTESEYGRQLWGALCIELWHRTFIDGN